MQTVFFLALACLAASVWAGGYQGCLERVWLFQAYEIDALNSPSDQTMGYACSKFDEKTKKCTVNWQPCKKKRNAPGRCNFDELVHQLGKAPKPTGWSILDKKTGRLDVQETAKNCYKMYGSKQGAASKVPNFKSYKAMKGATGEYNDFVLKVSTMVDKARREKATDDNRHLWQDFDATTDKVNTARAGDHGPYLIKEAKAKLGNDMDIKVQHLGSSPATGEKWETVDWKETAMEARKRGVSDYHQRIKGFLDDWYRGSQDDHEHRAARQHHQVLRTFKRVADRARSCRSP